ncbi:MULTISPECIES: hypothetical protein [unclassified Lysinibacillus]|uniref:hypothetical protein n=1 Tax=unclassified Lysinibacillus TaxID=2636778 RepID=UPI002554A4DD|nr:MULTISPECIES: hypothetical protein [unclassified Lysinibacillus]MDM5249058.1 hypothetical protein [Lysinibacillus sp. G4S2]
MINHFYTFKEADFRYGLLALPLTLRFRAEQGFLRASVEPLPPLCSVQGLVCLAFPRESSSPTLQSVKMEIYWRSGNKKILLPLNNKPIFFLINTLDKGTIFYGCDDTNKDRQGNPDGSNSE